MYICVYVSECVCSYDSLGQPSTAEKHSKLSGGKKEWFVSFSLSKVKHDARIFTIYIPQRYDTTLTKRQKIKIYLDAVKVKSNLSQEDKKHFQTDSMNNVCSYFGLYKIQSSLYFRQKLCNLNAG